MSTCSNPKFTHQASRLLPELNVGFYAFKSTILQLFIDLEGKIWQTLYPDCHYQLQHAATYADRYVCNLVQQMTPCAMVIEDIRRASFANPEICQINEALATNQLQLIPNPFQDISNELSTTNGILLRGNRIVLPKSLQTQAVIPSPQGSCWDNAHKTASSFQIMVTENGYRMSRMPSHRRSLTGVPNRSSPPNYPAKDGHP